MMQQASPDLLLGRHALIDLSGCNPLKLNDPALVEQLLTKAAEIAKTTVLGKLEHQFSPMGFSMVLLLAESHLSIHTWPEHGYASLDLYSCNLDTNFDAAYAYLSIELEAQAGQFRLVDRNASMSVSMSIHPMPIKTGQPF